MFGPIIGGMSRYVPKIDNVQGISRVRNLATPTCVCLFLRSGKRREANRMCIVLLVKPRTLLLCQNGFLFATLPLSCSKPDSLLQT